MIVLQTLGVAVIHVGTRRVLPGATRAFGALLYLAVERGRAIPRSELQQLFFPETNERSGGHRLRQLLYRVRSLGAPLEGHDDVVILPAEAVEADYSALAARGGIEPDTVKAVADGVLPGYAPKISPEFRRWVEDQRSSIGQTVLGTLVAQLAALRAAGRWRELEPVARTCLGLDPLNEEATLALAEGLALTGQKAGAMQLLDRYLDEVAPFGKELRLPASVLRHRISEHVPDLSYRRLGPGPFVGRDAEMAELWRHYQAAKHGDPRAVVIHGEPGIGKTRLATEFLRAAALEGAKCITVECAAHDVRRPLGLFVDLVPKLLNAPGGLGVAPESFAYLQRLTEFRGPDPGDLTIAEPKTISTAIARSVTELFEAVAAEQPVLVLTDNAQFLDPLSRDLLTGLLGTGSRRRCLVLLTTREPAPLIGSGEAGQERYDLQLQPLGKVAAESLLSSLCRARTEPLAPSVRRDLVRLAVGNPLYLETALSDLDEQQTGAIVPTSLGRLIRGRVDDLNQDALHALAAYAIAGRRYSVGLLEAMTGLGRNQLLVAIQDLHDRRILHAVESPDGGIHPLVEEAVLDRVGQTVRQLLHHRAASALSSRATESKDSSLLWDCARHWEQAGEPTRGIEPLRSYAAYCLKIGQPAVACQLLQRASKLAPPVDSISLVKEAMNAAYVAEDYSTVRTLYNTHIAPACPTIQHDESELLEIHAARRDGTPLDQRAEQLWNCLSSPEADLPHRLRAAGTFVVYADGWFERDRASSAYDVMRPIAANDRGCAGLWINLQMLYHVHFGDPLVAARAAGRAVALAADDTDPWQALTLGINASIAYYIGGFFDQAVQSLRLVHERATGAGARRSAAQAASLLAAVHIDYGHLRSARHWDSVADHAIAGIGTPDGVFSHLSNKIELALIDGDSLRARRWLDTARSGFAELAAPHNVSIDTGYDLLISLLEGNAAAWDSRLDELWADHQRAKNSWSHDAFVEGLGRLLKSHGQLRQAREMVHQHLTFDRRERTPLRKTLAELAVSVGCKPR